MPFLAPPINEEKSALLAFLDQQRVALRAAAGGLTDAQAGAAPSVSQLSIAGLIKHLTRCEWRWFVEVVARSDEAAPFDKATYEDSFSMLPGETLAGLLDQYAAVARRTEEIIDGIDDLGAEFKAPEFPWFSTEGMYWSPRWVLLHLIEETARHAGHADIIRETLDGATAFTLIDAYDNAMAAAWA